MNFYAAAGNIFIEEGNTYIACNCLLQGLSVDEYNSDVWYFLAVALYNHSFKIKDDNLVIHSIASLKRSIQLNPQNLYPNKTLKELGNKNYELKRMIERVPIAEYDNIIQLKAQISEDEVVQAFIKLKSEENKTAIAMYLGETKNPLYYSLLKHCILEETDRNVQYAALKRIHHHTNIHNLKPIFTAMENNGVEKYQPYFTIALENIQEEWTEALLKKYKIDIPAEAEVKEEDNSKVTENIQAIFGLSYINHPIEEIMELYYKRDNAKLVYYLANPLNDEGLKILLQNKVTDNRGQFTELGWAFVKEYIDKMSGSFNDSTKKPKLSEKKSGEWWKFWK